MAGTVKHARLESPSARSRLRRGRQPHWQALVDGKVHLGYQRWRGDDDGRWVLRRYVGGGKYRSETIGQADDVARADGVRVLSHEQAEAKARAKVDVPTGAIHRLTVRDAFDRYIDYKRSVGQPVADLLSRGRAHILPVLGDLVVAELTADQLRRWLATMAGTPAQTRPKNGKPQFKAEPEDDEAIRRRRATANRVLTMLKAALNHAFDEGHVANRDAWGRRLSPFVTSRSRACVTCLSRTRSASSTRAIPTSAHWSAPPWKPAPATASSSAARSPTSTPTLTR
jgi:hypothetical protein